MESSSWTPPTHAQWEHARALNHVYAYVDGACNSIAQTCEDCATVELTGKSNTGRTSPRLPCVGD